MQDGRFLEAEISEKDLNMNKKPWLPKKKHCIKDTWNPYFPLFCTDDIASGVQSTNLCISFLKRYSQIRIRSEEGDLISYDINVKKFGVLNLEKRRLGKT